MTEPNDQLNSQAVSIEDGHLDRIELKKGTLIKLNGMPFNLADDTVVLGLESNYRLALDILTNPRIKSIA